MALKYDVHTHAFHPKIAQKAVEQLYDYYGIEPVGNGTIDDLLLRTERAGLDRVVVHSAATTKDQVVPANDWAISLEENYDNVIAFGTIHPDFSDWEKELARLENAGIIGLKLHPEFQKVWLNDKSLYPIFETIGNRFRLMIHVGDRALPEENFSCPYKIADLKKKFPEVKMIAAHFGGWRHWEYVAEAFQGIDIFIDTSSSFEFITDEQIKEIKKVVPLERWLFGSDYPLYDSGEELEVLQKRLNLKASELDRLLTSAQEFLGL